MKCPLFAEISKHQTQRGFLTYIDCLQEECAWWDDGDGQCSEKSRMESLKYIASCLCKMEKKMPHVGQFLK